MFLNRGADFHGRLTSVPKLGDLGACSPRKIVLYDHFSYILCNTVNKPWHTKITGNSIKMVNIFQDIYIVLTSIVACACLAEYLYGTYVYT